MTINQLLRCLSLSPSLYKNSPGHQIRWEEDAEKIRGAKQSTLAQLLNSIGCDDDDDDCDTTMNTQFLFIIISPSLTQLIFRSGMTLPLLPLNLRSHAESIVRPEMRLNLCSANNHELRILWRRTRTPLQTQIQFAVHPFSPVLSTSCAWFEIIWSCSVEKNNGNWVLAVVPPNWIQLERPIR